MKKILSAIALVAVTGVALATAEAPEKTYRNESGKAALEVIKKNKADLKKQMKEKAVEVEVAEAGEAAPADAKADKKSK